MSKFWVRNNQIINSIELQPIESINYEHVLQT